MRHLIARLVLSLVVLGATLAGCSDDDPAKSRFIEKADAICAKAQEKTRRLPEPKDEEDVDRVVSAAARFARDALTELRELEVPEGDAGTIDRFLDAMDTGLDLLPRFRSATETKDQEEANKLAAQIEGAAGEAQEIADDYGFEKCGSLGVVPAG